jgi:hypothetical protein
MVLFDLMGLEKGAMGVWVAWRLRFRSRFESDGCAFAFSGLFVLGSDGIEF